MGGTFDPVHSGHLRVALDGMETLKLDSVRWIPSGIPGHRKAPVASAAQRLDMLKLALADEPRFHIDAAELSQAEPTFSINTLVRLRAELGNTVSLVMLIGTDRLIALHTWKEWEKLFEFAHFGVANRPGNELREDELEPGLRALYRERLATSTSLNTAPQGHIVRFDSVSMAISATDIRVRLGKNKSAAYLIPATVIRYIESQALYRR
jgi:nicotinate-nucleotide adenylyltransferase